MPAFSLSLTDAQFWNTAHGRSHHGITFTAGHSSVGRSGSTNVRASSGSARAGNRRFRLLSALRAHTKEPHKTDPLWETQRALNRPGRARTVALQNRVRKPILSACGAWPCAGRTRRRQPWPRRRGPRPPPRSPETAAAAAG